MDPTYFELQKNAFLPLMEVTNFHELVDEFKNLNLELTPYTVLVNGKQYAPLDLEVASLIDKHEDPKSGGTGYGMSGGFPKSEIVETSLAKDAPVIIKTLYELFGKDWIRRVKISKLPPKSNMMLHTHPYLRLPNSNNEVVVHIPLQTNPGVLAVVSKDGNEESSKKMHFAAGRAWYLNTFYHHKFENNGNDDRYHLWINLVWKDPVKGINPAFSNFIKENLYQGVGL